MSYEDTMADIRTVCDGAADRFERISELLSEPGPTCATCRFFRTVEIDPDDEWDRTPPPGTALADWGECLRYPPVVMAMSNRDGTPSVQVWRPDVANTDWCGEWKPK